MNRTGWMTFFPSKRTPTTRDEVSLRNPHFTFLVSELRVFHSSPVAPSIQDETKQLKLGTSPCMRATVGYVGLWAPVFLWSTSLGLGFLQGRRLLLWWGTCEIPFFASACSFHPLINEEDLFIFEEKLLTPVKSFHVDVPPTWAAPKRARGINVAVATSPSYSTNPKAGPTTAAEVGFQDGLLCLLTGAIRSRGLNQKGGIPRPVM